MEIPKTILINNAERLIEQDTSCRGIRCHECIFNIHYVCHDLEYNEILNICKEYIETNKENKK